MSKAGYWISILSLIAGIGTFLGGFAADRLSTRFNDRRWYLWVPGHRDAAVRAVPVPRLSVADSVHRRCRRSSG